MWVFVCETEKQISGDIVERLGALALRAATVWRCSTLIKPPSGTVQNIPPGLSYRGPHCIRGSQVLPKTASVLEWCLCVESPSMVAHLCCQISVLCTKVSNPWHLQRQVQPPCDHPLFCRNSGIKAFLYWKKRDSTNQIWLACHSRTQDNCSWSRARR